jgi:hypothetical protein
MAQVAAIHSQWREHFVPLIFRKAQMTATGGRCNPVVGALSRRGVTNRSLLSSHIAIGSVQLLQRRLRGLL